MDGNAMRMWKMAAIAVATTVVLSCSTLHGSGFDPPGLLHIPSLGINVHG